jgi:hypothetical protein
VTRIANTEDELRTFYLKTCELQGKHLVGLNVPNMPSDCLVYHMRSGRLPSPWVHDVFRDTYWWEAMAKFSNVLLGEQLKKLISDSHGEKITNLHP